MPETDDIDQRARAESGCARRRVDNTEARPWQTSSCAMAIVFAIVTAATANAQMIGVDFQKAILAGSPSGNPADSPDQRVDPNAATSPYAGVGTIQVFSPTLGNFLCTATAITDRHILTAAHCLDLDDNGTIDVLPDNVTFHLNFGGNLTHNIVGSALTIHPNFTGFDNPSVNDDVAIVTLAVPLPSGVPIYPLRRTTVAAGTTFTLVGYGRSGDGVNGYTTDASYSVKRWGQNNADGFATNDEGGGTNEVFRFDFDGPTGNGKLGGSTLGNAIETTLGGGDSGGPSFVDEGGVLKIVGVNTHSFRFNPGSPLAPLFGSGGGGMLVPAYASWIDTVMGSDKFWDNPVGGVFGTAANWVGGAPSAAGDTARFNLSKTYAVTFAASVAHSAAMVDNDHVTLDLAGFTYSPASVVIGQRAGDDGQLTIVGGTLASNNASLGAVAGAAGSATLAAGSVWSNAGDLTVGGSDTSPGGTGQLTVAAGATIDVGQTLRVWSGGMVMLDGGSMMAATLSLAGGTLAGVGPVVGMVVNGGGVSPGHSPDVLHIVGDYEQTAAGQLMIEIGGLLEGEFARLEVSGSATLAGTLSVSLVNSFVPALGDRFGVLAFSSVAGDFDNYVGRDIGSHLALEAHFSADRLELVARPAIDGDINLDGVVDIFDINAVSASWYETGPAGDANGDGIVDIFDINWISANWTPIGGTGNATAVPEPATLILALCGLLGVVCLCGRQQRA